MSDQLNPSRGQKNQPKGLGRGLGSLLGNSENGAFSKTIPANEDKVKALGEKIAQKQSPALSQGFVEKVAAPISAPAIPENLRLWNLSIEKVEPNPDQPRQVFAKEALEELAQSIREKGIIQPLLVRKKDNGQFEIIAGERRWRAAQLAGLKEVPALIKDSKDQEVLELALIENIQRENLNVIEEAEAYDFLVKKYNLTQAELAQKVSKDRATVANVLRLLQLQPEVRKLVSEGKLSLGQAKVLLSVADPIEQNRIAQKTVSEALSVRALEKIIAARKLTPGVESIAVSPQEGVRAQAAENLAEELQKMIGSRVILDYSNGKGRLAIQFHSDSELNQLADRLRGAWQTK